MLLVMDTAGIFHCSDSRTGYSDLWEITWERIVCFLPNLREELFKQTVIAGTGTRPHTHTCTHTYSHTVSHSLTFTITLTLTFTLTLTHQVPWR